MKDVKPINKILRKYLLNILTAFFIISDFSFPKSKVAASEFQKDQTFDKKGEEFENLKNAKKSNMKMSTKLLIAGIITGFIGIDIVLARAAYRKIFIYENALIEFVIDFYPKLNNSEIIEFENQPYDFFCKFCKQNFSIDCNKTFFPELFMKAKKYPQVLVVLCIRCQLPEIKCKFKKDPFQILDEVVLEFIVYEFSQFVFENQFLDRLTKFEELLNDNSKEADELIAFWLKEIKPYSPLGKNVETANKLTNRLKNLTRKVFDISKQRNQTADRPGGEKWQKLIAEIASKRKEFLAMS
jgi:hypothetical protein